MDPHRVNAEADFRVVEKGMVTCYIGDRQLHELSTISEFGDSGECQMAVDMLTCAYRRWNDNMSPTRGKDQTVFGVRVLGTRFTFYRADVNGDSLKNLMLGLPPVGEPFAIYRFPPNDGTTPCGYAFRFEDDEQTLLILDILRRMGEHLKRV